MSWETVIPPLVNQSIRHVPNICNICNGSHYTGLCSSLSEQHIQDKPYHDNLSRYSVPDGLLIIDCDDMKSPIVITAQKFAKGTRFGPMLAPKSYVPPSRPNKFPLVIFNEVWNGDPFLDELGDDIKELFNVRNYYLDTSDENQCNWMIHVDIAKYSNEQNLMAYQENDQIYYTSTRDIELGDILRVWYSPSYATRMGARLLELSKDASFCTTNILKQVSFDYGIKLPDDPNADITNNNYLVMAPTTSSSSSSEITLPPINSIMKTPSPNYNNIDFDNLILMAKNEQMQNGIDFMDMYQMNISDQITSSDSEKMTQSPTSSSYVKSIKFTEMHDTEAQKFACETCGRKYITKSNLEKHMRSHDLFMCVVCMKMFPNPEELREHDCFKQKTSAKKSLLHCSICWKVLSNAWSLNRHMKIHRNTETAETMTHVDKSNETTEDYMSPAMSINLHEQEIFTIDTQQDFDALEKSQESMIDQNFITTTEQDPLSDVGWLEPHGGDFEPKTAVVLDHSQFGSEIAALNPPSYDDQLLPSQAVDNIDSNGSSLTQDQLLKPQSPQYYNEIASSISDSSNNYDKCIVCARVFKNPNSLEKHLRNVHTAHIIKPELTTSIKKSSEYRRIVLNKKPIKENVAKALVSKLNKKNLEQQQKLAAEKNWNTTTTNLQSISTTTENLEPITTSKPIENGIMNNNNNNSNTNNNNNTIIIISNVEINPANSPINNGYTFTNYPNNSLIPKLVPIGSAHNREIESMKEDVDPSPKVFVIDKSNEIQSPDVTTQQKIQSPNDDEQHQCPECDKVFQKKYQLKRHQDIHENLFYFCPFCDRAPVKARSSLRKHFAKDHPEHQETWQASSFLSSLLRKYEKVKKSSHESHDTSTKRSKKEPKVRKEKRPYRKRQRPSTNVNELNENHLSNIINNDEPLPQGNNSLDDDDVDENNHQHQQIILSNLFLDPITLDEENNLIKYTLAGDDDFIMNSSHNGSGSGNGMTHTGSIESYEMSEFSNFKSSFDEIQEKLDAELEFNNDQIKWSDELNDDDSMISSPCGSNLSSPETMGKSMAKQKKIDTFMLS